jgi:hypothetical protein
VDNIDRVLSTCSGAASIEGLGRVHVVVRWARGKLLGVSGCFAKCLAAVLKWFSVAMQ